MALRFHFPFSSSSPAINHPHIPAKSHRFLPFIANSSPSPSSCRQFHNQFPGCKVEFARNTRYALARIVCSVATTGEIIETSETVKERSVSVVLLAGGKGKRMGGSMPKQYLPLLGQPIALYSFYTFCRMVQVKEIIVVCDPSYREIFKDASEKIHVNLKFALPGKERQDSVFNGFQEIDGSSELVCIHDSARPLVLPGHVEKVLKDAWLNGAAVLGVPVKATIKEANTESYVVKTLNRKSLWEMQTPQVIKPELLRNGFELVYSLGLEVTDDVSIVEHLKHPVFITEGSYTNIKTLSAGCEDEYLFSEELDDVPAEADYPYTGTWPCIHGILILNWQNQGPTLHMAYMHVFLEFGPSTFCILVIKQVTTPDDLILAERILNIDANCRIAVCTQ